MPKRNQTKGSTATTKWSDMNIAGSIYFTVAYSPELAAKGLVKLKVGISNCDFKAANTHAQSGTTYSGEHYDVLACVPVDENTYIPQLTGRGLDLGGVLEMEQFLHGVFREKFNKGGYEIGDTKARPFMQCIHRKLEFTGQLQQCGKEWFYVPLEMIDLMQQAEQKGIEVGGDLWNVCPEVARCIYFAPAYDEVPSFRKERQQFSRGIWKVNTQRLKPGEKITNNNKLKRTPKQCQEDLDAPRTYSRKYMMFREDLLPC